MESDAEERRIGQSPEAGVDSGLDSLSRLIQALWELEGTFEASGMGGSWVFRGDRSVIHALGRFEEAALPPLIDCIDDFRLAQATVGGTPVMRGTMCAEVLRMKVIYEATDEYGGFDATWPGYTDPLATEAQLRAAKVAWLDVWERNAFMIP